MKRLFLIGVLLAVIIGVEALQSEAAFGAGGMDPLTLATIGFVVLASFAGAELGGQLGLPKVTGFIVAGLLLGPQVGGILAPRVVEEMRMFNTLALGLIATGAGLELELAALRRLARTLGATIGIKLIMVVLFVGAPFVILELNFHVLGLPDTSAALGLGVVFAALAIGTSPAIALAVLSETKAKGRLSELVLGAAVLKDVVVVVCLAIAVSIARVLTSPDATMDAHVLMHVAKELGSSILAGGVLGGILILYIRWLGAEMLLFVASMILVVAEISHALHLELLLVFIVAGFVVRNFSPYEHKLMHPLELVSLPVFVVFFTNAGASIDLGATLAVLPLALALCGGRVIAYAIASLVGGRIGGESPEIQRTAWLAYLPQAGVTLGLVGLASAQLTTVSEPLTTLGMAIVAVNLLGGPLTLGFALKRVGEVPGFQSSPAAPAPSSDATRAREDARRVGQPVLDAHLDRLRATYEAAFTAFVKEHIEPRCTTLRTQTGALSSTTTMVEFAEVAAAMDRSASDLASAIDSVSTRVLANVMELPTLAVVPLEPSLIDPRKPGLGVARRLHRRGVWLARRVTLGRAFRTRRVLLRQVVRAHVEPALARGSLQLLRDVHQIDAAAAEVLVALARTCGAPQELAERGLEAKVADSIAEARARLEASFRAIMEAALNELAGALAVVGAPGQGHAGTRLSVIEPQVSALRRAFEADARSLDGVTAALYETAAFRVEVQRRSAQVREQVQTAIVVPFEAVDASLALAFTAIQDNLTKLRQSLGGVSPPASSELAARARALLSDDERDTLRALRLQTRRATSMATVDALFDERASAPPRSVLLRHAVDDERQLHELPVRHVDAVTLVSRRFSQRLRPTLAETLHRAHSSVSTTVAHLGDILDGVAHACEVGELDDATIHAVRNDLVRADGRLSLAREDSEAARTRAREELERFLVELMEADSDFEFLRSDDGGAAESGSHPARWYSGRLGVRRRVSQGRAWIRSIRRRISRSSLSRDLRIISGLEQLDAVQLREYLAPVRDPGATLPESYRRLFQLAPLRDRRFVTANRAALQELVTIEQRWRDAGVESSALIVGRTGAGRTTLLNLAQLEMRADRVVRLDDGASRRVRGPLRALALELGCPPTRVSLLRELRGSRTVVLVDDVHHWLGPDPRCVEHLDEFLSTVVASRQSTLWVVTIEASALALVEQVTTLRTSFSRVLELEPLSPDEITHLIETRHRISGFDVRWPRRRWHKRLLRGDRRSAHLQSIAEQSRGNARVALAGWLRAAVMKGDSLETYEPSPLLALPTVLDRLPVEQVAALTLMLRHGPLRLDEAARWLGRDEALTSRHLQHLVDAGLVERAGGRRGMHEIAAPMRDILVDALSERGSLGMEHRG